MRGAPFIRFMQSMPTSSHRSAGSRLRERALELLLLGCAAVSLVTTICLVWALVRGAVGLFSSVSWVDFVAGTQWAPWLTHPQFGVFPLVVGTLLISAIALVVAVPIGLLAAIYLAEFATPSQRRVLDPTLTLLAGIPTIVYGFFALTFMTPLLDRWIPDLAGFNPLSPGIVIGVMLVPMIASLSADALEAVPRRLREGAWALGAGEAKTIFTIVVPAAATGIAASVALALTRALGETMIVTIAAGRSPSLSLDPRDPIETMSAYLVEVARAGVPVGGRVYQSMFAVGASLFVLTFLTNLVAQRLVRRAREANP